MLLRKYFDEGCVDPNMKNVDNNSILHLAVMEGSIPIVMVLVEKHRHLILSQNNMGELPLHHAAKLKLYDIVAYLSNMGGHDITTMDYMGRKAMSYLSDEERSRVNVSYFRETFERLKKEHH